MNLNATLRKHTYSLLFRLFTAVSRQPVYEFIMIKYTKEYTNALFEMYLVGKASLICIRTCSLDLTITHQNIKDQNIVEY